MNEIRDCVNRVHRRQQWQWVWRCASAGLLLAGLAACLVSLAQWTLLTPFDHVAIAVLIGAGLLAGWMFATVYRCPVHEAAAAIDQTCRLKDRVVTAMRFLETPIERTDWQELQLEDARQHLTGVRPAAVAPIRIPRTLFWGVLVCVLAFASGVVGRPADEPLVEVTTNEVVVAQADRVEAGLAELQEFETDQPDPQLDDLVQELYRQLQELRSPGVVPRDALAKLSEMEAALQEKQQQLQSSEIGAELAEIGEALALADEMKSAGEALAEGKLSQAAAELSELELPELDRQTKTAIAEELARLQQKNDSRVSDRLQQASEQTSEGLKQNDRKRFREGMQGLAEAAEKQAQRDRISDLLQRQARRLAECKSECAAETRSLADGNRQGARNWGLSRGENRPGAVTEKQTSDQQLKLNGQDSGEGDADTETVMAPEAAQKAMRRYVAQSEQYEQLTESVLEAEPIPPGQRQTIRRYFELIRPRNSELDAVDDRPSVAEDDPGQAP